MDGISQPKFISAYNNNTVKHIMSSIICEYYVFSSIKITD